MQFNTNYEWAKSLDVNSLGSQGGLTTNGNFQDSNNIAGNYGLSDFDVRHHFAGTAIYNLPFKGNRWKEGYSLQGIFQYQTGNPVNLLASTSGYNGIAGNIRPNLLGPINRVKIQPAGQTYIQYFQNPGGLAYGGNVCDLTNVTSACTLEVVGTQASSTGATNPTNYTGIGNVQRNYGTGPGFADWDMSAQKQTTIWENVAFTLRVDAFDILNHPNFGQPTGNVQSAAFGQINATRFATSDGGSSRQLQISGKFTF